MLWQSTWAMVRGEQAVTHQGELRKPLSLGAGQRTAEWAETISRRVQPCGAPQHHPDTRDSHFWGSVKSSVWPISGYNEGLRLYWLSASITGEVGTIPSISCYASRLLQETEDLGHCAAWCCGASGLAVSLHNVLEEIWARKSHQQQ